jgi:hypothetical protein
MRSTVVLGIALVVLIVWLLLLAVHSPQQPVVITNSAESFAKVQLLCESGLYKQAIPTLEALGKRGNGNAYHFAGLIYHRLLPAKERDLRRADEYYMKAYQLYHHRVVQPSEDLRWVPALLIDLADVSIKNGDKTAALFFLADFADLAKQYTFPDRERLVRSVVDGNDFRSLAGELDFEDTCEKLSQILVTLRAGN